LRLISLTVANFRCYAEPITVEFESLTALVGRNDVGKSSLMDALAIFFETSKPDKDDACKSGNPREMRIACEFDQLPENLVVDTDFPTTLQAEHLLTSRGTLVIRKTFDGSLITPKLTATDVIAEHPTSLGYHDLLSLKKADLIERASELGVDLSDIDKRKNAPIREALWSACEDLQKAESPIPLEIEGGRQVWTSLQPYLPTFALFKSDRASTDQDAEAQDPLKAAIREAIKIVEEDLQRIQDHVEAEVKKIAAATVEKLREMDPSVAETLDPIISIKKWDSLFSTSITGDEGIPLNKRGSGVKRLVLLNFFRAKAEKDASEKNTGSIIYGIEEPETSQHPRNQRLLLGALRELSSSEGRQVILTTHTPMLARYLDEESLRYIQLNEDGSRTISDGSAGSFPDIARSLGVLPDHNVKIFVGVEGPHDIAFLKHISRILVDASESTIDLERLELDGELIFVPLGGSNLALWAARLAPIKRPEFHICDRDAEPPANPKYSDHMAAINGREGCCAVATNKRELENYLHHESIREAYAANGIDIELSAFGDFEDVPCEVAKVLHAVNGEGSWEDLDDEKRRKKESRAKKTLNDSAAMRMTVARLDETDPDGEIRSWLEKIAELMVEPE